MCSKKIAFVSTYTPQRLGIGAYTKDLIETACPEGDPEWQPLRVAIADARDVKEESSIDYVIRKEKPKDYRRAADALNADGIDLVCLQHDFGLFGGPQGAGEYLDAFLSRIEAPLVTTMHSIPDNPSQAHFRMVRSLAHHSRKLVVMSHAGLNSLHEVYGIGKAKIEVIPYGIPDVSLCAIDTMKQQLGLEGRTTILTAGLLEPDMGIETVLRALPKVIPEVPNVLYILLGAHHSKVVHDHAESYRHRLEQMIEDLDLHRHVVFQNTLVSQDRLNDYILAADFYVTPHPRPEQVASGILAQAVGLGCAAISTPHGQARELLADDCGRLLRSFTDATVLADTLLALVKDPSACRRLRRRAFRKGRKMIWPVAGQAYWELFAKSVADDRSFLFPASSAPSGRKQLTMAS